MTADIIQFQKPRPTREQAERLAEAAVREDDPQKALDYWKKAIETYERL